jgi:hypothetical protein
MAQPNDYGLLLNGNIKLHRTWFKQMTSLIGINCQYKAPIVEDPTNPNNQMLIKEFDIYGDLKAKYPKEWTTVGCIFQDHPEQKTLKKMGWVAELQENASILHVPYDLPGLQVGCLFNIPSGLDNAKPRLFRVIEIQNIMVYPASVACEVAPEYETIDEPTLHTNFTNSTLPLLKDNEGDD